MLDQEGSVVYFLTMLLKRVLFCHLVLFYFDFVLPGHVSLKKLRRLSFRCLEHDAVVDVG